MEKDNKKIEVCLGVGLDQIFPEITILIIPQDDDEEFTDYEIVND